MTGAVWADVDCGLPTLVEGKNINSTHTQSHVSYSTNNSHTQKISTVDHFTQTHPSACSSKPMVSFYQAASGTLSQYAHLGARGCWCCRLVEEKRGMCSEGRSQRHLSHQAQQPDAPHHTRTHLRRSNGFTPPLSFRFKDWGRLGF